MCHDLSDIMMMINVQWGRNSQRLKKQQIKIVMHDIMNGNVSINLQVCTISTNRSVHPFVINISISNNKNEYIINI